MTACRQQPTVQYKNTGDMSVYNQRRYARHFITEMGPKMLADWQRTKPHTQRSVVGHLSGAIWTLPPYDRLRLHPRLYCAARLTRLCTILCLSSLYTPAPQNQYTASGVIALLQDQSGHPHTDQSPDKIVWALKGLAADGRAHTHTHTHTHTHKEGNNEVPPELPHDKHHTNSPWRLGKEKLSLSLLSLSFLTQCPIYLLYLTTPLFFSIAPSSFPPDSVLPSLLAGVCVCVDVL